MRPLLAFFLLFLCPWTVMAAEDVTIQGRDFYLDGKPWLPKGIKIEAFMRPAFIPSAPKWINESSSRDSWTDAERAAIKTIFGATVLRFSVSQPALDPESAIYDPKYLEELLGIVKQARQAGFVVIASMASQDWNGVPGMACMPWEGTARAWTVLAPRLASDSGVMFELFDEPCKWSNPDTRKQWAGPMQAAIDAARGAGARNILLVDGLWWARQTKGLLPLLHDPLPNRMALAVHPYLVKDAFTTEQQWNDMFGADAMRYPMIATEWNATETSGCVDADTPQIALSLIRYLQRIHVGLIIYGIDSPGGKVVKDHQAFEPSDYQNFRGCLPKGQPAPKVYSGGGRLLANFPNN